jgi:hypothetical protein
MLRKRDAGRTNRPERPREAATLSSRGPVFPKPGAPCQVTCDDCAFRLAKMNQFERGTEAAAAHLLPRFFYSLSLAPSFRASLRRSRSARRSLCCPGPGKWASLRAGPTRVRLASTPQSFGPAPCAARAAPDRERPGTPLGRIGEAGRTGQAGEGETEPSLGGGASEQGQLGLPPEAGQWGGWGRAGGDLIGGSVWGLLRA